MSYRFYYEFHGDRHQPVVLFLHGFMGDQRDFVPIMNALFDRFYSLAVDLPGHGKTIVTGDDAQYGMAFTAAALVDWLDQLQISRCGLVGYSMGGRLALYLALHFPHRFPRVVLESASPGLKTDRERQTRLQRDHALADQLEADFPSFLNHWYQQPLFASLRQHPDFAQMLERRSQNHPPGLAKSLRYLSTGQQPSLWHLLEQHRQPLLLLVGENDHKFCMINQEMAACCPTMRLTIVSHCGHVIHFEQPDKLIEPIATFFSEAG
jgi:2-succinyl-6-hydroxy-2,4-cyclohexadiene-1-carboxylate synthase